ncbi:hypothetical protein [Mycobacterium avium]|nr:hypothetical protein [Mycobacterium avium]ELP45589.1 hypothetical protein D522_15910 [Mycobacterium avium subsp. paratuberculosis S5]ETB04976.1 hypothetical protein O979_05555 [Mycobacterium avium subsp. paratuberculosis 10-4404]ETB06604.1 hypothetical protein O978_05775 [Mycobacterium avium subsp. paratuberculosis 10-5864]ETB13434.1 hypothetical protein O980_05470 [Mycobacterium avium subsp. paratuberculosis 08-8281]ETB34283.1 hypothetical protein O977_06170 [Mycobacterium avium subsp. par
MTDMAYRMSPRVEMLAVKDQNGIIWHHYQRPVGGARNLGPIIAWIGPDYRDRWLRMGLIEEIPDDAAAALSQPPPSDAVAGPNTDLVDECIAALDRFDVPADAGAPTARKALRDRGQAWGNETIAAAVRARKARAAPSGTPAGS